MLYRLANVLPIWTPRTEANLFLPHRPGIESPFPARYDGRAYETCLSHLILTLKEQCNLRCRYCSYDAGQSAPRSGLLGQNRKRALKFPSVEASKNTV